MGQELRDRWAAARSAGSWAAAWIWELLLASHFTTACSRHMPRRPALCGSLMPVHHSACGDESAAGDGGRGGGAGHAWWLLKAQASQRRPQRVILDEPATQAPQHWTAAHTGESEAAAKRRRAGLEGSTGTAQAQTRHGASAASMVPGMRVSACQLLSVAAAVAADTSSSGVSRHTTYTAVSLCVSPSGGLRCPSPPLRRLSHFPGHSVWHSSISATSK